MKRIFTLSTLILLVVIVASSRRAKAQDKKEIREKRTIIITDADTIINGKKFSEASPKEKEELRKKLSDVHISIKGLGVDVAGDRVIGIARGNGATRIVTSPGMEDDIVILDKDGRTRSITRSHSGDVRIFKDGEHVIASPRVFRYRDGVAGRMFADTAFIARADTAFFKRFKLNTDSVQARVFAYGNAGSFPGVRIAGPHGSRKNSQSFSYSHTDNEGITTRSLFTLSDAGKEQFKKISGTEGESTLTLGSISVVPDFESGKTNLRFRLAGAAADVKLTDSNGKTIASGKTVNGVFDQNIDLPRNGAYYLSVNQGGKWAVKRLVKE